MDCGPLAEEKQQRRDRTVSAHCMSDTKRLLRRTTLIVALKSAQVCRKILTGFDSEQSSNTSI